MGEKSKFSFLLNYGPNEDEIFNFVKELNSGINVKDNRTEIIKRSINAFQYLIQIKEMYLLNFLSTKLKEINSMQKYSDIDFVKNLSLAIYSSMICKKGLAESELFESIILNLSEIEQYLVTSTDSERNDRLSDINQMFDYMIKSIDIVFLKKNVSEISLNEPPVTTKPLLFDNIAQRDRLVHGMVSRNIPTDFTMLHTTNIGEMSSDSENMFLKFNPEDNTIQTSTHTTGVEKREIALMNPSV